MKKVVPSTYQKAIYRWVTRGSGCAVVKAVAGSGKTFTVIEAVKKIPPTASVVMLAFNRRAADDLKSTAPDHADARTFHSLGYGALRASIGKLVVCEDKVRRLCRETLDEVRFYRYAPFVQKLVSFAKAAGVGVLVDDEESFWTAVVDHHDLTLDDPEATEPEGIQIARAILRKSTQQAERSRIVDFDDQLYLPVLWRLSPKRYDWVFVDEAQDTNPVRQELARKALRRGGRLVAVGDPNQAIYGFTGASTDAMDHLEREFDAEIFPLSVNYRCCRAAIELAQTLVPEIQAHDGAPEGTVVRLENDAEKLDAALRELGPKDAVLCRFTAPLVTTAYKLIGQGIGCRILGREIGEGLLNLVKKMRAESLEELYSSLQDHLSIERTRLLAREQEARAQSIEDRITCLFTIMDQLTDLKELTPAIERLFTDSNGVLTLSTVHKAKGGEWPTVLLLAASRSTAKMARKRWQQTQETNIRYVAYTRAKERLIISP